MQYDQVYGGYLLVFLFPYHQELPGSLAQDIPLAYPELRLADSHDSNPLGWLVNQGLRQALVDAIGQLPEREQLLLSLQFVQDLNQKEIAAVLRVTEGRVSQLRSQAIARIRAWLAAHSWDQGPEDNDHQTLLLQALL